MKYIISVLCRDILYRVDEGGGQEEKLIRTQHKTHKDVKNIFFWQTKVLGYRAFSEQITRANWVLDWSYSEFASAFSASCKVVSTSEDSEGKCSRPKIIGNAMSSDIAAVQSCPSKQNHVSSMWII